MAIAEAKYDELTLVQLLKSQDKSGYDYLYKNYSGALYGVIMGMTDNNEEWAQDILQDVFVKVWRNIAQYDSTKARLYTWMLNITRNSCIDALRNKHHKHSAQIYSVDNVVNKVNQEKSVTHSTDNIGLTDTLNKLKPEHQQLVDLFYYKGYTHEEISEALNIPLGTVKSRIRSALIVLRDILLKTDA